MRSSTVHPIPALLLVLAACGGGDDKGEDTDTTPVIDDTFPDDTDSTPADSTPSRDSDDTGAFFAVEVRGEATVFPGSRFNGWQAITSRWTGPLSQQEGKGVARCMFTQSMTDWKTAFPSQADPLQPRHKDCPRCDFVFTVSLGEPQKALHYPSTLENDTDTDTDLPPPDVVEGQTLNCTSTQRQTRSIQDFPLQVGVGFDADNKDASALSTTGTVLLFIPEAQTSGATWAPYAHDAVWDKVARKVTWDERVNTQEYVP
ncbi:MAG: hypothetical protein H6732_13890 [Alphaproteobacteria bacterium]|nr:hypothetical protein [Alphaproteobacteria bacterium]